MMKRNHLIYLLIPLLLWVRRHYFITLAALLAIFIYFTWNETPAPPLTAEGAAPGPYEVEEQADESHAPPAVVPAKSQNNTGQKDIPPVPAQANDGNALFTRNLLSTLAEEQYKQYGKQFYLAMLQAAPGEQRGWKVGESAYGYITPGEQFEGSGGRPCREYEETYVIKSKSQRREGIACQGEKGGWCKLRKGSTPNCALSREAGMFADFGVGWHNTTMGWNRFKYGLKNLF